MKIISKEALSYAFYDFANSSYTLVILTFTYAIYFKTVVASGIAESDFLWGIATAIPVVLVAVVSPFLGALADIRHAKRFFLIASTLVTTVFTALLATVEAGEILKGMLIVIIASIFYHFAIFFYDAFIVDVTTKKTAGRVSGFSWGLGYIGGLVALLIIAPFIKGGVETSTYSTSFLITALFYTVFSLPMFFMVKQKIVNVKITMGTKTIGKNIQCVWQQRKRYRSFFLLVLAFFFYNDALTTLFTFVSVFATTTIGMSIQEVATLLFASQLVAFPAAWAFGAWSDRIGQKKVILITLFLVLCFSTIAALASSKTVFFSAICLASLGVGASQSCTRALIGNTVPRQYATEFFGFQTMASKLSAFLGPVLFGFLASTFHNQRLGYVPVAVFLGTGMLLLMKVKEV